MHEWRRSLPIRIVVPGAPKAWERAGHRIARKRDGRQFVSSYTPAQTRREQSNIRAFAHKAMDDRPPLTGPIELRFVAYMPIAASWSKKKQADALADRIRPTGTPDLDNCMKQVDSFKELVWRDDAQVTDAMLWKRYSDRPRLVIEVYALECRAVENLLVEKLPPKTRTSLEASMREAIAMLPEENGERRSFLSKWESIIRGLEI